jgi:hypothetical protein
VVYEFINRWTCVSRPTITLDAAFGGLDLAKFLQTEGFTFLISVNQHVQNKFFWAEMKYALANGQGRVMVNRDDIIASIFFDNNFHTVLTNNWYLDENSGNNTIMIDQVDDEICLSLSNNSSIEDSTSSSISDEGENDHPGVVEYAVDRILCRKKISDYYHYQTLWSTGETTHVPFSCFVDEDRVSLAFIQYAVESDWNTGFQHFTKLKLQRICTFRGISKSMSFFF